VTALVGLQERIEDAKLARAEAERLVQEQAAKNDDLQYIIDHGNEDAIIEDIARDKLGLVMPGEKVFYDGTK